MMMMAAVPWLFAAFVLLLSSSSSVEADEAVTATADDAAGDIDYSPLGSEDLSRLQFSVYADVNENQEYTLQYRFKHDLDLPVGDADICTTTPPPIFDGDGMNYLQGRWMWQRMSEGIRLATGVDHVSIDWNPCGHPGHGFQIPHYDVHPFRVTPDYRLGMICNLVPQTPACDKMNQTTDAGKAFFLAKTADDGNILPPDFELQMDDAIIFLGMHSASPVQIPATSDEWTEPILIMVTYDGEVVSVEPMFPLWWVTGEEKRHHMEGISYVHSTGSNLPYSYAVDYDGSGYVVVTYKGESDISRAEFYELQGQAAAAGTTSAAFPLLPVSFFAALTLLNIAITSTTGSCWF